MECEPPCEPLTELETTIAEKLDDVHDDIGALRGLMERVIEGQDKRAEVQSQAIALTGRAGAGVFALAMRVLSRDVLIAITLIVLALSGGTAAISNTDVGLRLLHLMMNDASGAAMAECVDTGVPE